jgi:hypothetical protein
MQPSRCQASYNMTEFKSNNFTLDECQAELELLFPEGFAAPDIVRQIAPAGWKESPLLAVFHPSPEQLYQESLRIHENLCALRRPDDTRPLPDPPTREEPPIAASTAPGRKAGRRRSKLVGGIDWTPFRISSLRALFILALDLHDLPVGVHESLIGVHERLVGVRFVWCAVKRCRSSAGAIPARQLSLQPVAIEAAVAATKSPKPSMERTSSGSASRQAVT